MKKKIYSGVKRLLSILLALILLTSYLPLEAAAAGAHSMEGDSNPEAFLENKAIHVDVSRNSGAFYIRTVAGDKLVKGDEYANLLWPGEDDTSFTSVRITRDGTTNEYIFGKDYGSGNTVSVTSDGTQITAVWTIDSVTFTQNIRLQPTNNDAHGMVVISYSAENKGAPADIGIRVLLDTAMGGKDYAYYNKGDMLVDSEQELGENGYERSIYLMDDPSDPLVTGYILNGSVDSVESKPAKTVFAHWANLASTIYDYTPDTTLNFTNAFNAKHLTSDSAVALYYDLGSIETNAAASKQFNYGLYSNEKVSGHAVAVNLQTIDALTYTDETESAFANDGKFTARTILQNASGKNYNKVRIYAYASGGISVLNSDLSPTDGNGKTYGYDNPYYVEINGFANGQKVNDLTEWNFQAVMAAEANYGRIHFKVYDMSSNYGDKPLENNLIGEAKKYILVPGSHQKLPQIQFTGSSPNLFYTEGHRVFNVTGMKFASLEAETNNTCSLKLSRKDGGVIRDNDTSLVLPTAAFTIKEDGSGMMAVEIDGNLPEGDYKVTVDYTDSEREDIDAKALEFQVINDTRYKCETYGFVAVYHDEALDDDGKHPKHNYLIKTFPGQESYENWKNENHIKENDIIVVFKGVFDDLTDNLPDDVGGLKDGESYACYLSAALSDDTSDVVIMSNVVELSYRESGSNVVIKEIKKGEGDKERHSVKVDFDCKLSIAGVGNTIWNLGPCCLTELKGGTGYRLVEYDESGERDDTAGNTISLIWPGYNTFTQSIMGATFNFRYAELGIMTLKDGSKVRTAGFGGGLDLSCIIPKSADEYYSWEESTPKEARMSPDEQREWAEAMEVKRQQRTFSEKNKDRAREQAQNGFYDDDDNINFSGSVQVSDILFGARSFLGFNIQVGVGIPPLAYGLPSLQGVFTLRTIGQTEFRVNGNMRFAEFELEALLDLKANDIGILIPDEFKFFIGGITPGVPLDPWGVLWLQGGGGGIKDIYETIYLQDKVPPLKLILQAQFSLMQVMVAKATVEVGLSGLGVALNDVRIAATDIAVLDSAVIALRWYPNIAFIGSVQINLKDCIEGGGYIVGYLDYEAQNPFFEFFVRAALKIPDVIPIFGGFTAADVNMGISTERIFGKASYMGVGLGFSYYWRGDFDWGMKNEATPTFPELLGLGQEFDTDIDEMFENIPTGEDDEESDDESLVGAGFKAVPVYYDEENHRTLMAVPGTNLVSDNTVVHRGETLSGAEPDQNTDQNTLDIAPDGKTIEVSFANNQMSKIAVLTWDSKSEEAAETEAATISTVGYNITMLNHELDANLQKTANANLTYDPEAKKASLAIFVTNSLVRNMSIASLFPMDAVLYDVNPLPELEGCSAALNDVNLTVNLAGNSIDSFDYVNVALFRESELAAANADSNYVPEITLAGRIEKENDSMPASSTIALPADLPSGRYVVRLMAQDEAKTQISQIDLTESVVEFVNPYTPGSPASIGTITSAGDWKVNIPINPGTTDDFDGYAVSVIDSEGAPVTGLTDLLFYRNGEMVEYANDGKVTMPEDNTVAQQLTVGGHMEVPVPETAGSDETTENEENGSDVDVTANDSTGLDVNADNLTKTEIYGFKEGAYTVSVRKWKAASDDKLVYSEAITQDFTVSAPAPAVITLTGTSAVTRTEQRGEETIEIPYYNNRELRFTLSSDKPVTGSWVIDNMEDEPGYHAAFQTGTTGETITLVGLKIADGVHTITFTGTTENGDVSSASCVFGVDDMAPALLISSPENGGTFDGTTGEITFTGTTDANAVITLFDKTTDTSLTPTAMSIDPDTGNFTLTVTLSSEVSGHQVTLKVSDDLGNSSEKLFALRNSLLTSITSLHLYDENNSDKTELPLVPGPHILKVVGKTADSQTVEMNDPSMIEWDAQTLEGSALNASLSEDGTKLKIDSGDDTVGVITAKFLVNDAGAYPVSCMVGSKLSVSSSEITVMEGAAAPLGVSAKSGATLTFESADPSIAEVSADNEGIATVTGVKVGTTTITVSADGESANVTVNVVEADYLYGNSISLEGDIGVNFYMEFPEKIASSNTVYMKFTVPSGDQYLTKEIYVKDIEPESDNKYVFKCNVAVKEMDSTIRAQLYDGDEPLGREYAYTIREYANALLDLADTSADYKKAEPLVQSMLQYGEYAKAYFSEEDTLPDLDVTIDNSFAEYTSTLPANLYDGSTLSLKSKTTLSHYFISSEKLTFSCVDKNGKTRTIETAEGGDCQVVRIRDIAAAELQDNFTVTVKKGEEVLGQITYSPMNYCYMAQNQSQENQGLKKLAKALYLYAEAAKQYFQ